ncbi:MAG: phospholipase [Novosphingobium pentaromativorans]|uniref:Phospholipase A1 n=1 Tax=Novosphingobium pentaromativorans TaxID=205844 RepID=A0A2W5NX45_9SPHN|nr:MAG: phospholipase [Novosphingobium pentaromativorans]
MTRGLKWKHDNCLRYPGSLRVTKRLGSLATAALISALSLSALPGSALAQESVETLIGHVTPDENGGGFVDLRVLNTGTEAATAAMSETVEARISRPGAFGRGRTVVLRRDTATPAEVAVAPGSFATACYRLAEKDFEDGAVLSVPGWSGQSVTLAAGPKPERMKTGAPTDRAQIAGIDGIVVPAPPQVPATPPPSDRTVGNAFLENMSAYEPIYAVYGPGTDAEARIQLSFKYQLFGSRASVNGRALGDGLFFAYTQRMFWDLGAKSSPFRNIDFQPEVFYVTPGKALSEKATVSAQIGMRHESNGRDGVDSRSLNTIYVAPAAAFSLGEDTRLTVAPRVWLYAGDLSDNPDIRRYRGNTGLFVEIGEDDGLRLSSSSRFNFGSGKGSISADVSYPLRRLLGGGPDFYLFAQSFAGYGENLLDYNRRVTRLRVGVALVR